MRVALERIFWFVVRMILRLRYRVRVDGLEQLRALEGPVLILPNHPCYIDPPTVLSHLYRTVQGATSATGLLRNISRPVSFTSDETCTCI